MGIVIYNSYFSNLTGKRRTIDVKGETVGACLQDLTKQFPEMKKVMYDEAGNVQPMIRIFVNRDATRPAESATPVKDGDELHLLAFYPGG